MNIARSWDHISGGGGRFLPTQEVLEGGVPGKGGHGPGMGASSCHCHCCHGCQTWSYQGWFRSCIGKDIVCREWGLSEVVGVPVWD